MDQVIEAAFNIHNTAQIDDIEFIIGYCDKDKRELISIKNKQLVRNCKVAWIGSWNAYNEFKCMENEITNEKIKGKQAVVFDENGKPVYVEKLDEDGNPVLDADGKPVYETEIVSNDIIISDGDTFWLGDGEYIIVNYLPQGTTYTITEVRPENGNDDYDINIDGEKENSGVITDEMGNVDTTVEYVNEYHQYELPETGGSGLIVYTIAGALCLLLGAGFMYRKKFRGRRV